MEPLQNKKIISINYVKKAILNDLTFILMGQISAFKHLNFKSKLVLFCSLLSTIAFLRKKTLSDMTKHGCAM